MSLDFSSAHVLITGGAGFVGSHLVEYFLRAGAQVVAVDNYLTGQERNLLEFYDNPRFMFVKADVTQDPASYLPQGFVPTLVLHFASPASPPRYQAFPVETYLVNSYGTHQLLQYLKKAAPQARFIFASTSEVYGDPALHPQPESYWGNVNPNGIRSCYDEAKRLGESICGVHYRDFGLDVRIVRIFNTYGPKMDLEDGRVIPNLVKCALDGVPLTVYGDGSQTRSYCFVTDLVAGIARFAQADGLAGQTINLGNPGEFTVKQTAELIVELMDVSSEISYLPLPADDPKQRKPDLTKARELLSWEPTIEFRAGLQETIAFFRQVARR